MYTTLDFKRCNLAQLGKFDAIWIDPPLQEYVDRVSPTNDFELHKEIQNQIQPWDFEDIKMLPIKELAATQSFIYMWIGSGEYLEKGRELLKHWGYRRCEDIVWLKTTKSVNQKSSIGDVPTNDQIIYNQPDRVFKRQKEH